MKQVQDAYIVAAARTPIGRSGRGYFRNPRPDELLVAAIRSAMLAPEMAEALAPFGLDIVVNTPAELAKAVKEENAAWGPIVKRVGFTPES